MITVFGSINVDLTFCLKHLPSVGETVLTPTFTAAVGGKGANQVIAAARDGAQTSFVGCVGTDAWGETARKALADAGVHSDGLQTVPGATGLAVVWVDAEGRNQIAVASGANRALQAEALARSVIPSGQQRCLLLQMETPVSEVEAAISHGKQKHSKIILNLAPALPLSLAALRQVDILVLNEHEAALLNRSLQLPDTAATAQALTLAAELGNSVIITLGAAGAVAARKGQVWRVEALPVRVIDSTGAGDCFVGVLAAALMRGASLPEAVRRAAVAGSLACTGLGATPSFPRRGQIDAALAQAKHTANPEVTSGC
jgi:ribokinase